MNKKTIDTDDLNQQYLPSMTVANALDYLEASDRRSARVRRKLDGKLGVSYGKSPNQLLDIFPAAEPNAPVHIYIHGGYWRATYVGRSTYSHLAAPMVAAGATVVLPDYDLCPNVRITDIVEQMRQMLAWVHRNIRRYNGDPKRIYVSGHSAGGQLTGMLLSTPWRDYRLPKEPIRGAAMLSGLFDIEPHRHTALQPDIRLTAREAKAMSPLKQEPLCHAPAILAVGGNEPHLFHWQSLQYAAYLRERRIEAEYISTPGDNHFTITDRLGKARDPLTRRLIEQMFSQG